MMLHSYGRIAGLIALITASSSAVAQSAAYRGTADDYVEISQLFARYDFSIDNKDGIGWADTFTPDGVFRDPSWCAIGRQALIGVVGTNPQVGHDLQHRHVPTMGPITYVDRDHATVHSTVMLVTEKGAGHPDGGVSITGSYDDTLVRHDGRWLFAYRYVQRPSPKPPIECSAKPPFIAEIRR